MTELVVIYGGRRNGRRRALLDHCPPRIQIGAVIYDRVDDPDTGVFLGAYVANSAQGAMPTRADHAPPAEDRSPILTGFASRRAAGVRKELQHRAETALGASRAAEDEREAAALRGKAHAFREAVYLVRALENGHRIGRRRRNYLAGGDDRV